MLIITTIPPRRDGKVYADCGGEKYEFCANGVGDLVCEVGNAEHAAELVGRRDGFFLDASPEDCGEILEVGDDGQDAGRDDDDKDAEDDVRNALGIADAERVIAEQGAGIAPGTQPEAPAKRRGRPPKVAQTNSAKGGNGYAG